MPRKRARHARDRSSYWWAAGAAAAVAVVGRLAARQRAAPPGGWRGDDGAADLLRGLPPNGCDVDAAAAISLRDFEAEYRGKKPLLLRGAAAHWPALEKWTRAYLLEHFGDRAANVGTGSDIIYAGGGAANHATLRDLLRRMRNGSDAVAFDARLLGTLPELARDFAAPPVLARAFPAAASYGLLSLGPSRSGLPPHAHGEAWLGLVAGRKRWFLREPGAAIDQEGAVHPLASIRDWAAVLRGGCLQAPGDVLYVPRGWTHATLNVGEALAVGEQAQWPAADRLRRARAVLARAPDDVRALHSFGVAAAGAEINQ